MKQLGWARELGGAESLGISTGSNSVSQVDGVSDMAPACWLRGSAGGGPRKRTMASALFDARPFRSSLYVTGALQAALLALELRGSESE